MEFCLILMMNSSFEGTNDVSEISNMTMIVMRTSASGRKTPVRKDNFAACTDFEYQWHDEFSIHYSMIPRSYLKLRYSKLGMLNSSPNHLTCSLANKILFVGKAGRILCASSEKKKTPTETFPTMSENMALAIETVQDEIISRDAMLALCKAWEEMKSMVLQSL